jgi:hypothetical protein
VERLRTGLQGYIPKMREVASVVILGVDGKSDDAGDKTVEDGFTLAALLLIEGARGAFKLS